MQYSGVNNHWRHQRTAEGGVGWTISTEGVEDQASEGVPRAVIAVDIDDEYQEDIAAVSQCI